MPAALADAFRRYEIALTSANPAEAAQNMLAANVMAVAYEQRRLQPHIVTALDVGIRETLRELPRWRPLRWLVHRLEAPAFIRQPPG